MEIDDGKVFIGFLVENVREIRNMLETNTRDTHEIAKTLAVTTQKVADLADYQKEMNGKVGRHAERLATLELWKEKQAGMSVVMIALATISASVVGFALSNWTALRNYLHGI